MNTRVKKIWVCWEEHRIFDNYKEVVDYSIDHGMVLTFGEWLTDYSIEQVFEMTEDEKKRLKAGYSEYVKARIADYWKEKEIVF